ncbi:MAG TPA: DUF1097 domain-containing protein [Gemmatimonadales bacterium]|nr:DUF1097 domain-containing protein [Gemmatimonadales bacterium]
MNRSVVLALAVAVSVAIIVKFAPAMSISPLPAIIALAVFLGSGGGVPGFARTLAAMLLGAILMIIANIIVVQHQESLEAYRWLFFAIVALIIMLAARVPYLSYVTAGLAGMAMAGGTPAFRPYGLLVGGSIAMGCVLGLISDIIAGALSGSRSAAGQPVA